MKTKKSERDLYFDPDDFKIFIKVAYDYNMTQGILWDLISETGCRISEALSLRPKDFNPALNTIAITTLKTKGHPVFDIIISARMISIIFKYIHLAEIKDEERLFKFSRQWAWKEFKKILKLAGITYKHSPHSLRHMHGTITNEATGGNLQMVAKRLRHSNNKSSERYVHLSNEGQKLIVNFLTDKLQPKKDK